MAAEAARLARAIDLLPVGTLPAGTLQTLAARLSRRVRLPCHVLPRGEPPIPRLGGRDQIDAAGLLEILESRPATPGRLLVGVTADDLAIAVFTFVFGLARHDGRVCVVSLARTDPGFYGLPLDQELRNRRAIAEILHELGHLASLNHCPDQGCLMSFAGTVEKVDSRGMRFCGSCAARLPTWMRGPGPIRDPA
jgi:archaemetzincin